MTVKGYCLMTNYVHLVAVPEAVGDWRTFLAQRGVEPEADAYAAAYANGTSIGG